MQRRYNTDENGRAYCQLDDFMLSLRQLVHCERSYSCSLTVPVDMTEAIKFAKKEKKITITAMVVRASAIALKHHPILAGRWLERIDRVYLPKTIKIFLPVQVGDFSNGVWIDEADKKSIVKLAEELNERVKEAKKEPKAQLFPLEPFFVISNVGTLGMIDNASALLTGDAVSSLIVCSIIEKPWIVDGRIETRKIMNLTMVWDHFAVLASTPAEFLTEVKNLLEKPEGL